MKKQPMIMVALLAVLFFAGNADSADNSSVSQGKEGSSLSVTTSFFEGTWSGAFTLGLSGTTQQDITITIGNKNAKGYYKTTYSWGWGKSGLTDVPPGSFIAYGKEKDGFFVFGWKNKEGSKRTIKMEKIKDDVAKVRLDQEGQMATGGRPYYEAEFKRK